MIPDNPLLAASRRIVSVTVEYNARGVRTAKTFAGPKAVADSRAFYRAKLKAGADPRIVGARRNHP